MRILVLASLLGLGAPPLLAQDRPGSTRTVDGRREPEKLPDALVWEGLFAALHDFTEGRTDPRDPRVEGFVAGNLYLSYPDTSFLLQEVARARRTLKDLEGDLTDASVAERGPDEIARIQRKIERATLDSRDRILKKLSPQGAKALRRYEAIVRQGMQVEVPP